MLPLDGESFLRIQQEQLFSNLFGTNTKIGDVYDILLDPIPNGLDFGTYSSMAITHDNQVYQVDAALIFPIEITSDNEYEQPNIDISESENVRFYGIYGKMSTTTNSVYFFGLAAYQESQNQYILIPISEIPDATEEEYDQIREYVSYAFTESLFIVGGVR